MHAHTHMQPTELTASKEQLAMLHAYDRRDAAVKQDSLDDRLAAAQRRLQLARAKAHANADAIPTTLTNYNSEEPCSASCTAVSKQQSLTAPSSIKLLHNNKCVQLDPTSHTHKITKPKATLPQDESFTWPAQTTDQIQSCSQQHGPWPSMHETTLEKEPSLQEMLQQQQQQEPRLATQDYVPKFTSAQAIQQQAPHAHHHAFSSPEETKQQQLGADNTHCGRHQKLIQAVDDDIAQTILFKEYARVLSDNQCVSKQPRIQTQTASQVYKEPPYSRPKRELLAPRPLPDIAKPPATHEDDLYVRHIKAAQCLEAATRDSDLERLKEQLAELSDQVLVAQATAQELSVDKKALIAERTAVIVYIQGLEAVFTHHTPTSHEDDLQEELHEQQWACAASKQRFVDIVAILPDTSSVKPLLSSSELLHVLEGLHTRVAKTDKLWRVQLSEMEEQRVLEEQHRRETEQKLEASQKEVASLRLQASKSQAALEQLQSDHREQLRKSDQQLMEATKQLAGARERLQEHSRQACNEVYELQQQLLASESHVKELQQRTQRMATEAEAAQFAAQVELQQQAAASQNKHMQEVQALQDTHASIISDLQKELAASQIQAQAAVSRLQAVELSCQQDKEQWQVQLTQAASLNDQLSQQLAATREEKLQLQVILQQAEQQMQSMRQDLDRVRQQHDSLRTQIDKAKQSERQEMLRSEARAQEQDQRLFIEQAALQALQKASEMRRDNAAGQQSLTRPKSVPRSQRNPTRNSLHVRMPGQLHSDKQVEAQRPQSGRSKASLYGHAARQPAKFRHDRPRSPDI